MDGVQSFDRDACLLPRFRAAAWNELVFVNLDPAAMALEAFLGELVPDVARND